MSEFDTNHGNKETNWQAVDMSTQCLSRWDWYHEKDIKSYFISKNHRLLFWHWPSKCKEYKQLLLDLLRYFVFCLTLSQTPFKHQVRFQSSRIQNCSSFCTFVPFLRMVEKWNMWLWCPQKGARKIIHFIRRWYNRGLPKLLLRKMLVSKDKV